VKIEQGVGIPAGAPLPKFNPGPAILGRSFAGATQAGVKIQIGVGIPAGAPLLKFNPGPAILGRSFAGRRRRA